jgi:hypothetical protein
MQLGREAISENLMRVALTASTASRFAGPRPALPPTVRIAKVRNGNYLAALSLVPILEEVVPLSVELRWRSA